MAINLSRAHFRYGVSCRFFRGYMGLMLQLRSLIRSRRRYTHAARATPVVPDAAGMQSAHAYFRGRSGSTGPSLSPRILSPY